jgi:SAM-dependent methyltransferase
MSSGVECILCGGSAFFRRRIPKAVLEEAWDALGRKEWQSGDLQDTHLCECSRCELQFFHPFQAGGTQFYRAMSRRSYRRHVSWRWEHEQALSTILGRGVLSVLELGCGDGGFLELLDRNGVRAHGFDLNADERTKGGLRIWRGAIESAAIDGQYDCICAFQVLEHLEQPARVLEKAIGHLNAGGLLILGVPNREGITASMPERHKALDLPPHHASRWNATSLRMIGELFGLTVSSYAKEPLSYVHYMAATMAQLDPAAGANRSLARTLMSRIQRLILAAVGPLFYLRAREHLDGHGHLIVFERRPDEPGARQTTSP